MSEQQASDERRKIRRGRAIVLVAYNGTEKHQYDEDDVIDLLAEAWHRGWHAAVDDESSDLDNPYGPHPEATR